ncbi:MAG: TonB family protein [Colwellia polaris]|jgi:TonB family protein|uniref:M56 family metallopeptidase n=1 Tax=Colwellia polaris TaxID=326537 RepID=UPI000A16EF93|nr:M56 family metallopeptidase [Colwellia polaris]|tara:strand:+ start:774 stop:2027 length:1254 start_codon:yes stop_codon:yes gene_type:complete
MINLLLDLLWPLTLMLTFLLLCNTLILKYCGAKVGYFLWSLIPVALLAYLIPIPWQEMVEAPSGTIQRYMVTPTEQLIDIQPNVILTLWLVGTLFVLSYWLISHIRFKSGLKLTELKDEELVVKLPSKLNAFQSNSTYSPMLLGLISPKLIIPANFTTHFSRSQQALILEHEICHFDRNDIYWNTLALLFVALFWFHPLVWLAYRKFRQDQELSCDQVVLARKQTASRIAYSKALLVVAEFAPKVAFAQLSFKEYGDKQMMFERIKQIKANTQATKLAMIMVSAISVSLLSGVSFAGNQSQATTDNIQQGAAKKQQDHVKPTYRVEPKYPEKAVVENIEGSVVLKFDIDQAGSVKNVEVVNGSPAYVFDKVAKTALEQWRYEASNSYHKNNLVQLDFALDKNSARRESLIEQIKVTK